MAVISAHIKTQYKEIDSADFHQRLLFIEEHFSTIEQLEEEDFYFFKKEKIQVLFELGKYEEVLDLVDEVIAYYFSSESDSAEGLPEKLLFQKASSLLNSNKVDQAISLSTELVGISPFDSLYHKLLRASLKRGWNNRDQDFKIISFIFIGFIFLGSVIMSFGLIESQHFSNRTIWFALVGIPLFLLFITYATKKVFVKYRIEKELNRVIRSKKEKRNLESSNLK